MQVRAKVDRAVAQQPPQGSRSCRLPASPWHNPASVAPFRRRFPSGSRGLGHAPTRPENPRVPGSIPGPGTPTSLEHRGPTDPKVPGASTFFGAGGVKAREAGPGPGSPPGVPESTESDTPVAQRGLRPTLRATAAESCARVRTGTNGWRVSVLVPWISTRSRPSETSRRRASSVSRQLAEVATMKAALAARSGGELRQERLDLIRGELPLLRLVLRREGHWHHLVDPAAPEARPDGDPERATKDHERLVDRAFACPLRASPGDVPVHLWSAELRHPAGSSSGDTR